MQGPMFANRPSRNVCVYQHWALTCLPTISVVLALPTCGRLTVSGVSQAGTLGVVADGGAPFVSVEAGVGGVARFSLDATKSASVFGDIVAYRWLIEGVPIGSSPVDDVTLSVGRHEITLEVRDEIGLHASTIVVVTVEPFSDPDALPLFSLPWAPGRTFTVSQGNDGPFTHQGRFAWDFPMPVGTPVLAVAAGRVIDVRDDVPAEGSVAMPAATTNFVSIDHGRGLQSFYAHLDEDGVVVEPGQLVAAGQVIGFSGDTGFSGGPHLHYEVFDVLGESVATGFVEAEENDGIPDADDEITSANRLNVASIAGFLPSPLPADAFAVNGIELTGATPPAFYYENQTDYQFTGQVVNGDRRVCVALVEPNSLETVLCDLVEVDDSGAFVIHFRFPSDLVGQFFFGVIGGPDGAEGLAPQRIVVKPRRADDHRPVAVIDPPPELSVDFGETRPLSGGKSISPRGRPLLYQWTQVSGPLAAIEDPTAAQTTFTLAPGDGLELVAFQLVVSDGIVHSLPAQVQFRMPDTFLVNRIGISSTICLSADACPVFDPPPPIVTFSTELILGWVEVFGARVGDELSFTITDPLGEVVLVNRLTIGSEPASPSFWRFGSTSVGLDLLPGVWLGTLNYNGLAEATVEFRVEP